MKPAHPLFQAAVPGIDILNMENAVSRAFSTPCVECLVMQAYFPGGKSERTRAITAKQGILGDMWVDKGGEII